MFGKVVLGFLKVAGVIATILSGGYLLLVAIWLLDGGMYLPNVTQPPNGVIRVFQRSVFDDNNWIRFVVVHRVALPLSILIVAIILIRYSSRKSSSVLKQDK